MNLREYLEELDRCGQLLRISRPVNSRYEIAGLADRLSDRTLIFERVVDFELPVLANLSVHRALVAELAGTTQTGFIDRVLQCISEPLATIRGADDAAAEVITRDVNLFRQFPITIDYDRQERPALNSGVMVARDQETGLLNTSFHVLQVIAPDEFVIHVSSAHFARAYSQYQKRREPMPAAVLVGIDPWTWLASALVIPHPPTELDVAGALLGHPLGLRRCVSVDLDIPCGAEVVLEGEVLPNRREPMGPKPAPSGYYGVQSSGPIFKVKCWSRRTDALFLNLVIGTRDHWTLLDVSREVSILPLLRKRYPGIRGLSVSGETCVVSLDRSSSSEAPAILTDILQYDTQRRGNFKIAIVLDPDVNIYSRQDVQIALGTRLLPEKIQWVEGPTTKSDPSSPNGRVAKLGVDATVASNAAERFHRPYIPWTTNLQLIKYMSRGRDDK